MHRNLLKEDIQQVVYFYYVLEKNDVILFDSYKYYSINNYKEREILLDY